MDLFKDIHYILAYNWIPVSAKCCKNLSNIRRVNASSGAGFAWTALTSPVQRTPALHGITREKAPFFPESGCHAHVCVCPLVPVLLFLPFFPFRGKKSRRRAVNQSPRDSGANERAEIARWAGLNAGSARVLNTSYLADRWVLRLPLAQLVACWLVVSDLHWWTLGSCGTRAELELRYLDTQRRPSRVNRVRFLFVFAAFRAVRHYQSRRDSLVDPWERSTWIRSIGASCIRDLLLAHDIHTKILFSIKI